MGIWSRHWCRLRNRDWEIDWQSHVKLMSRPDPSPLSPKGEKLVRHRTRTKAVTIPSPLGEGQTDMPINQADQGEVQPTRRSIVAIEVRSKTPLPSAPNPKGRFARGRCPNISNKTFPWKPNDLISQKRNQAHAISFRRGASRRADHYGYRGELQKDG